MKRPAGDLPVDPVRLRSEFPELTEEDLAAWSAVTTRLLSDPARGRTVAALLARAREARERAAGSALSPEDTEAVRYLSAMEKMQRSTVRKED